MGDIIAGTILGALMLLAKFGSWFLLTGGEEQWYMPFTGMGARDWWSAGPVRKFIVDATFGYVGAHIIPTNSTAGLFALGTYTIVCMFFIFRSILWNMGRRKAKKILATLGV